MRLGKIRQLTFWAVVAFCLGHHAPEAQKLGAHRVAPERVYAGMAHHAVEYRH